MTDSSAHRQKQFATVAKAVDRVLIADLAVRLRQWECNSSKAGGLTVLLRKSLRVLETLASRHK